MKFLKKSLQSQKGIAIPMAVMTVTLIFYLATEISYETNVDYISNSQAVSRIKAYYAAKSGVDLSLMRIKIYSKAKATFGKDLEKMGQTQLLDNIWNFPFMWPPVVLEETNSVDKDLIQSTVKESLMDAQYSIAIEDEGSKIDINDLASPSKALRESTQKMLLNIYQNKMNSDEAWANEHKELPYEIVLNNIIDWEDEDTESLNNGAESSLYSDLKDANLPPNRGFRSIDELRLVAGMNEEIFNLLKDRITVYGMKGINPNYANKEVLKSISPVITDEHTAKIIERREAEAFKEAKEFWGYLAELGVNVAEEIQNSTPLIFNNVANFRIKSTGLYAKSSREITAIVYDMDSASAQMSGLITKEQPKSEKEKKAAEKADAADKDTTNPGVNNNQATQQNSSKGAPQIVYWSEK